MKNRSTTLRSGQPGMEDPIRTRGSYPATCYEPEQKGSKKLRYPMNAGVRIPHTIYTLQNQHTSQLAARYVDSLKSSFNIPRIVGSSGRCDSSSRSRSLNRFAFPTALEPNTDRGTPGTRLSRIVVIVLRSSGLNAINATAPPSARTGRGLPMRNRAPPDKLPPPWTRRRYEN